MREERSFDEVEDQAVSIKDWKRGAYSSVSLVPVVNGCTTWQVARLNGGR